MTCDFIAKATSGVQGLKPYQPGKPIEELERELGISNIVKLASNENPLPPSEHVKSALSNELPNLSRYPDGNGFLLKRALSEKYHIHDNQITLGNGSNDILELLARVFLTSTTSAVYSQYSFAVYPLAVQAVGARGIVARARDWGHDLEAILSAIQTDTRLVYLANPNNPTGTWFSKATFDSFIERVPEHVVVVLDEAYCEYLSSEDDAPNGLDYIDSYPNLVVTRTFSKAYGLAALRVGYAISHPDIADLLNRVRQPFNVNQMAMAAATIALNDEPYLQKSIQVNRAGMQQLVEGLAVLGLTVIPSKANFVCVNFEREAMPIYTQLLHKGVIVRPTANYQMPNFLRVSVGLHEENVRFLEALTEIIS